MIRGLDVSAVQGKVDWPSVYKDVGCRFAIIKCAEGNRAQADPKFAENVAEARAAGLVVGAYNFAYPLPSVAGAQDLRDPVAQARHHCDLSGALGAKDGDLPPALDLEWPPPQEWGKWGCSAAQIREWGLEYLDEATRLWGVRPLVYTYPDFWAHLGAAGASEFAQYPLWMAAYTVNDWPAGGGPLIPHPWTAWTFWQWAGGGSHKLPNGVPVDFDVFAGDDLTAVTARALPPVADLSPAFVPPDPNPNA